jgi:electron transport complex protein RnfG
MAAVLMLGAGWAFGEDAKPTGGSTVQDQKPTGEPAAGSTVAKPAAPDLEKSFKKIFPDFDNKPKAEVIFADDKDDKTLAQKCEYEVNKGCKIYPIRKKKELLGFALIEQGQGFKGPLKLMLGLTPDGDIAGLDVLSISDTPQLGGKVAGDDFQQQFLKKNLKNTKWALEKDSGDIRAVSGASYSSNGVVAAVKETLEFYEKHKEDLKKQAASK